MAGLSRFARLAQNFLSTPKGKQVGGDVIGRAATAANRATGGKHASRIESARRAAEKGIRGI